MSNPLPMRVLIIEDEGPASEKLERYLNKYNPGIQVVAKLISIAESIAWLRQHQPDVDLIFMDVQLTDGLSFNIFQSITVSKPVIFITAFNEYALDAFKANGIDYLLKPLTYHDLETSLNKLANLKNQLNWAPAQVEAVKAALGPEAKSYKHRFMVKLGDHIKSITTDQISFFFADGRDVYLITNPYRKFIVDYTLEVLQDMLDPKIFHRINRSYIVNINAIQDVVVYSNSRLRITPIVKWETEMIVSREKVSEFKSWFDGGEK
jgi:two-component system, LytTR family, response regulator